MEKLEFVEHFIWFRNRDHVCYHSGSRNIITLTLISFRFPRHLTETGTDFAITALKRGTLDS